MTTTADERGRTDLPALLKRMPAAYRPMMRTVLRQGGRWVPRGKNKIQILSPTGAPPVTLHTTPSSRRGLVGDRAQLRRAGFTIRSL